MTIQLSAGVRNARLDAIETTIAGTAILKIFDGAIPANTAAADVGTELAVLTLPADYFNAASGGTITKNGTWEDTSADATGTAEYFRMYDNGTVTCHIQGTVSATGGGGDMEVDSITFTAGQSFTVTAFTLVDGNA